MSDAIMSYVKKIKETAKQKKQPQKPSGKKYFILFGIIFFISAWMFVLGVLVGRGTAPVHFDIEKLQKDLAALKEAVLRKERQSLSVPPGSLAKGHELGFYEALKETRELPEKTDLLTKLPPRPKPVEPVVVQPRLREKFVPTKPVPLKQKRLSIQIASLKDPKAADRIVERLGKKGYPAYRVIGKISGRGIWYRVRIGYYQNRSEAEGMLKRLREDKIKGIIVNR